MGSNPAVTWTLVGLTLATVALTAWDARDGLAPSALVPSLLLLSALAAWLLAPRRPAWAPPGKRLLCCDGCGTQWRPVDEGGARTCPVCT